VIAYIEIMFKQQVLKAKSWRRLRCCAGEQFDDAQRDFFAKLLLPGYPFLRPCPKMCALKFE